jgi:DNA primase large subunit
MEDLDFAVRYPFSSQAKAALDSRATQLSESIVLMGSERIKRGLKGDSAKSAALHESDKINEIASFAAARMLLAFLNNRFITNKFAVAESKRVSAYLDSERDEAIIERVGQELGFAARREGQFFLVPIPIYLSFSPRALPYKLINREIRNGNVVTSPHERVRLMEEAVRKRLERVPLLKDPPKIISDAGKALVSELPKTDLPQVQVKPGDYPPCIIKLLDSVKKHENLNHQARWFLCVYLMAAGLSDEEIIGLYSNLPDFSERITTYQVQHARKKGYTVPACATVTTWGFCCADCRIGSPLYWRGKGGAGK